MRLFMWSVFCFSLRSTVPLISKWTKAFYQRNYILTLQFCLQQLVIPNKIDTDIMQSVHNAYLITHLQNTMCLSCVISTGQHILLKRIVWIHIQENFPQRSGDTKCTINYEKNNFVTVCVVLNQDWRTFRDLTHCGNLHIDNIDPPDWNLLISKWIKSSLSKSIITIESKYWLHICRFRRWN